MSFVSKFDADLPIGGQGSHAHVETVSANATHAPAPAALPALFRRTARVARTSAPSPASVEVQCERYVGSIRSVVLDSENAAAPNAAMGQGAPSCRPVTKISAAQAPKARIL